MVEALVCTRTSPGCSGATVKSTREVVLSPGRIAPRDFMGKRTLGREERIPDTPRPLRAATVNFIAFDVGKVVVLVWEKSSRLSHIAGSRVGSLKSA